MSRTTAGTTGTNLPGLPPLQDGGILSVFLINVVVGVVAFVVLSCCRFHRSRRYESLLYSAPVLRGRRRAGSLSGSGGSRRKDDWKEDLSESDEETEVLLRQNDLEHLPKPQHMKAGENVEESFFSWLWPLFKMGNNELAECCGNDAMLYLRFQRVTIFFWALCTMLALLILLPLNLSGGRELPGFSSTTVANVAYENYLWLHAMMTVIFSLLVYVLVYHFRRFLIENNERYRKKKSMVSAHSLMISNYPADYSLETVSLLRQHFEEMLRENMGLKAWVEQKRIRRKQRSLSFIKQEEERATLEKQRKEKEDRLLKAEEEAKRKLRIGLETSGTRSRSGSLRSKKQEKGKEKVDIGAGVGYLSVDEGEIRPGVMNGTEVWEEKEQEEKYPLQEKERKEKKSEKGKEVEKTETSSGLEFTGFGMPDEERAAKEKLLLKILEEEQLKRKSKEVSPNRTSRKGSRRGRNRSRSNSVYDKEDEEIEEAEQIAKEEEDEDEDKEEEQEDNANQQQKLEEEEASFILELGGDDLMEMIAMEEEEERAEEETNNIEEHLNENELENDVDLIGLNGASVSHDENKEAPKIGVLIDVEDAPEKSQLKQQHETTLLKEEYEELAIDKMENGRASEDASPYKTGNEKARDLKRSLMRRKQQRQTLQKLEAQKLRQQLTEKQLLEDFEDETNDENSPVVAVHIVPELSNLIDAVETYRDAAFKLLHYENELAIKGERPRLLLLPDQNVFWKLVRLFRCEPSVDAISYFREKKRVSRQRVIKLRQEVRERRTTGNVFVTFSESLFAKAIVNEYQNNNKFWGLLRWKHGFTSQSKLLRDHKWVVKMAPEPEDIVWTNLGIGKWEQRFRLAFVNFVLMLFLTFFTTPVSITSMFKGMNDGALVKSAQSAFHDILGSDGAFVFAYLPTLMLLLVTSILPLIIWASSNLEGHHTNSATHKSLAVKTYVFLLFNVLILPGLWLTSINALAIASWNNRSNLFSILDSLFLPTSGAFYINSITQFAILGSLVEVLRLPERLWALWQKWNAVTEMEKAKAVTFAYPHEYGMQYAFMITLFATSFVYSITTPLIVPFGLMYFGIKHFVDLYSLVYVRPRTFESDGSMNWVVLKAVLVTCFLFQIAMSLFLYFHGTLGQFLLVASVPFCTLMGLLFSFVSGISCFMFTIQPKSVVAQRSTYYHASRTVFESAYLHEFLRQS
ncbi:Transmembrane protein 63C [Balamuthia mandrillaris]